MQQLSIKEAVRGLETRRAAQTILIEQAFSGRSWREVSVIAHDLFTIESLIMALSNYLEKPAPLPPETTTEA